MFFKNLDGIQAYNQAILAFLTILNYFKVVWSSE